MTKERCPQVRTLSWVTWAIVLLAVHLPACGSSGSEDSNRTPETGAFRYTLRSGSGALPAGRRVTYIAFDGQSPDTPLFYDIQCYPSTPVRQVFTGTVATPGELDVDFQITSFSYINLSIYLDLDDSGTLTSGDTILGAYDKFPQFTCSRPLIVEDQVTRMTWEELEAAHGGTIAYNGADQQF